MKYQPGDRVFAMESATDTEVKMYGFGIYEGDFPTPTGPFGQSYQEVEKEFREMYPELPDDKIADMMNSLKSRKNPRIKLDDGQTVWGMQCWWGTEDSFNKVADGRTIVTIPVPVLGV